MGRNIEEEMGAFLPWSPDFGFSPSSFNSILNPVERQLGTKELEDLSFQILWDIWLKVKKI